MHHRLGQKFLYFYALISVQKFSLPATKDDHKQKGTYIMGKQVTLDRSTYLRVYNT